MNVWSASALIALAIAVVSPAAAAPGSPRELMPLAEGWRFLESDSPDGQAVAASVSAWQTVTVPHSWNRVGYYLTGKGGAHSPGTVNKYQGRAWYRKSFDVPGNLKGRRAWLEFDAASRIADIWVNGRFVGSHRGGFSRFRIDVTSAVRSGAANLLAVRVDNSKPALGGTTADVLPLAGDFFVHGGLYRPVRFIMTSDLHIDMMDSGGPGIRTRTAKIGGGSATVAAEIRVTNDRAAGTSALIVARIFDASGAEVGQAKSLVKLAKGETRSAELTIPIARPRLWQGTADPYLYRLVVDIEDPRGLVTDAIEQPVGIRQMAFDANRGFLLNGRAYQLRGVGYHQDRDGKGWAASRADIEADISILREMGANSIRLTHYQHGQDIHDIADREGIILWDEIPLVSVWTIGDSLQPSPELRANARQQLRELIRQNQNHPSVAIWGIANEVDFGNSLPVFVAGRKDGKIADPIPLLEELNELAKSTDPSRPTSLATCCEGRLFADDVVVPEVSRVADLGGANRYFGWYFGKPDDLGPHLDGLRDKRPGQPLAVTEYGAGAATSIHTDNVLGGPIDSRGRAQPEEYSNYIHETALSQIRSRPYLYATWLWNMFDFATTIRAEGDAQDINTKGLVTYDRSIKKDVFYFYKANWSGNPTVHIVGRRHNLRAYATTDVKVYSNAAATELFLNGKSHGVLSGCPQNICIWNAVALSGGDNAIRAVGKFPDSTATDSVEWELPAQALERVAIDSGSIIARQAHWSPVGSDNFFLGGEARSLDVPADYGKPAQPAAIVGSPARDALASYREGDFAYRIPMRAGRYLVRLWFTLAGDVREKQFDVLVGGRKILGGIARQDRGKEAVALSRDAIVKSSGLIEIKFRSKRDKAAISLIEINKIQ